MAAVEVQVRSLVVACHVSIHCDDATAHATPPLLTFCFILLQDADRVSLQEYEDLVLKLHEIEVRD